MINGETQGQEKPAPDFYHDFNATTSAATGPALSPGLRLAVTNPMPDIEFFAAPLKYSTGLVELNSCLKVPKLRLQSCGAR